jgi:hypothetical protein
MGTPWDGGRHDKRVALLDGMQVEAQRKGTLRCETDRSRS